MSCKILIIEIKIYLSIKLNVHFSEKPWYHSSNAVQKNAKKKKRQVGSNSDQDTPDLVKQT